MRRYSTSILILTFVCITPVVGYAQESEEDQEASEMSRAEQIETLLEMVRDLQSQIDAMREEQQTLREENEQFRRELREGMRGDDVETLQEMLATDPSIYPQGLVTGYYGPLTRSAIERFREKHGLGDGGEVDDKTRSALNRLYTEGAGNSGIVPPGLLTAPGLADARCRAFGSDSDRCERSDDDKDEDEDDDNESEKRDETEVEIEYESGVYSVEGEVTVATPCHELEVDIVVEEGDPDEVEISIQSVEDGSAVCAKVLTEREFEQTFEAGADAQITVTVDGEQVEVERDNDNEESNGDDDEEDDENEDDEENDA